MILHALQFLDHSLVSAWPDCVAPSVIRGEV